MREQRKISKRFPDNFEQALASELARMALFRIHYFVPHPDQKLEDAGPLMLYSPGLVDTAHLFASISTWPGDIRELHASYASTLTLRQLGYLERSVNPVDFTTFAQAASKYLAPFVCVISTEHTQKFVQGAIETSPAVWLHVSTEDAPNVLRIENFSRTSLLQYIRRATEQYATVHDDPEFFEYIDELLRGEPNASSIPLNAEKRDHGVTRFNELALEAFGFTFPSERPLKASEFDAYVPVSVACAELVEQCRSSLIERQGFTPRNRYILTALSTTWISHRTELRVSGLPSAERKFLTRVWKALLNQERHFTQVAADERFFIDHEWFRRMIMTRTQDARTYVASLALHAAHDLTPVLRLEPRINKVRSHLWDIGQCARGNGPHREFKLRKLVARLMDDMLTHIDSRYLDGLRKPREGIDGLSLVTDLPLELIPIDGVPIGLRFDCSRIPITPGNVSFSLLASHRSLQIPLRRFADVLVVRSFGADDRLRNDLACAIGEASKVSASMPSVQIVDVATPAEFVTAVRDFAGAIMIFDGHGARDPSHHTGQIIVGGEPMNLWLYRDELRLPPIVLLSACDTFPIDGSHGSSALGFLNAGAHTVVGTLLPILAGRAALTVARLLLRIGEVLPDVVRARQTVDWRAFMSELLRMAHVTEIAFDIAKIPRNELVLERIQQPANILIGNRSPDWAARTEHVIREVAGQKGGHLLPDNMLCQLSDAMKYIQLGHPELIQIIPDEWTELHQADALNKSPPNADRLDRTV